MALDALSDYWFWDRPLDTTAFGVCLGLLIPGVIILLLLAWVETNSIAANIVNTMFALTWLVTIRVLTIQYGNFGDQLVPSGWGAQWGIHNFGGQLVPLGWTICAAIGLYKVTFTRRRVFITL